MDLREITFPEWLALLAHVAGVTISIWMGRWDLVAAGIAFGVPSALLFHDLSPSGRGLIISFLRKIV